MATREAQSAALAVVDNTTTGSEVVPQQRSVLDLIKAQTPEMRRAIGDAATADRMSRIVMTEVRRNPKLLTCTVESILGAAMLCAQTGLEPGPFGLVYLIPRNRRAKVPHPKTGKDIWIDVPEVHWEIGYKGMIELALRHPAIRSVEANDLCEGDLWIDRRGRAAEFVHEPARPGTRGRVEAYYSFARLDGVDLPPEILTPDEIDQYHRARSESFKAWAAEQEKAKAEDRAPNPKVTSPWVTDRPIMCRKTLVRVQWAFLPKTPEMVTVAEADSGVIDLHLDREPEDPAVVGFHDHDLPMGSAGELGAGSDDEEQEPAERERIVVTALGNAGPPEDGDETVVDLGGGAPVEHWTVDAATAKARELKLIPASARPEPARKALHGLVNEALERQVPLLDEALAEHGPEIVGWMEAEAARRAELAAAASGDGES